MRFYSFLLLFILWSTVLFAQSGISVVEKDLAMYNDYFVNADSYKHRVSAHKKFIKLFEDALNMDNSFNYPFDSLKWISGIIAPDSSFRVFSWQLTKSPEERKYFGFLQLQNGQVFRFKDNNAGLRDLEYSLFSDSDWFGQIYYNIIDFKDNDKSEYIIFGYKLLDDFEKVKTAMPLTFDNNEIVFGKEIFKDTVQGYKTLIALKTSVNSASSLNYDKNRKMIVYDHTVSLMLPDMKGKLHATKVPDGSYHGYKWNGEVWEFVDRVFDKILDKAPRNKKHETQKGLFGN